YSIKDHYPYGMHCLSFIHPEDRGRAKHDLRQLKTGNNTGPNEYRAIKRDGSIIFIESRSEIIRDHNGRPDSILYIIRDITKRKAAERIIHENEERFTTIFQEVPDPLLIVTSEGTIIDMNRRCEEWFSIEKKASIGSSVHDIGFKRLEETSDNLVDLISELLPGKKIETQILLPDNTRRYTILSAKKITIGGSPAVLLLINDIDEMQRAYKALTLANNQLNLLNSITRHDILNKVMIISGFSEILLEEHTDESTVRSLGNIIQAGNDIKNLIEFTKEYQDLGVAQPKWHSIYEIMNKPILKSISSGIALSMPDVRVEIFADPMLEKVLYNLVENSKRHGGAVNKIILSFMFNDEGCILTYADNGLGIACEDKEKIFHKGYGKNTGLGLFIIREILAITGLTIQETGFLGEGVRFEILVPNGKFRINQNSQK
ncbi:MAG TPA: PAS domain-containing sensor histidine kinase, partial [Methanospirillum sp.]|nr:PAS domain-containing sensor histidine kinase [Methanospirillum sp.]